MFDPEITGPLNKNGVVVQSSPVKYLGTYLGLGNLSKLNFEQPLRKAKEVLNHWSKRTLTLDGQILVLKIFVVLLFIHVLNTTFISTAQIDLIQKLCLDFLWKGKPRVKISTIMAPYNQGGLKMVCVKNIVHALHVKWVK